MGLLSLPFSRRTGCHLLPHRPSQSPRLHYVNTMHHVGLRGWPLEGRVSDTLIQPAQTLSWIHWPEPRPVPLTNHRGGTSRDEFFMRTMHATQVACIFPRPRPQFSSRILLVCWRLGDVMTMPDEARHLASSTDHHPIYLPLPTPRSSAWIWGGRSTPNAMAGSSLLPAAFTTHA